MAELVDALGSGPSARLGCGSSSLLLGTIIFNIINKFSSTCANFVANTLIEIQVVSIF